MFPEGSASSPIGGSFGGVPDGGGAGGGGALGTSRAGSGLDGTQWPTVSGGFTGWVRVPPQQAPRQIAATSPSFSGLHFPTLATSPSC
jgi:hypothetical protein